LHCQDAKRTNIDLNSPLEGKKTVEKKDAPWVDQCQLPNHVMDLKMTARNSQGSKPSFGAVLTMSEEYAYVTLP
jgi:hypothetical protein